MSQQLRDFGDVRSPVLQVLRPQLARMCAGEEFTPPIMEQYVTFVRHEGGIWFAEHYSQRITGEVLSRMHQYLEEVDWDYRYDQYIYQLNPFKMSVALYTEKPEHFEQFKLAVDRFIEEEQRRLYE
mgnify:CR=1 FL=1